MYNEALAVERDVYRSDLHNGRLPGSIFNYQGVWWFFKRINKQEYETRSGFRPVSSGLSLLEASQLLAP